MAKKISELLGNFVSQEHSWKLELFDNWKNIIGTLADKVFIEKIEGNLIVLAVSHPVWAQEIFLLSDVLKTKINSYLKKDHIKQIRIKTTYFNKRKKKETVSLDQHGDLSLIDFKNMSLTKKEKEDLIKVSNQELRFWLEEFYVRCKRGSMKK